MTTNDGSILTQVKRTLGLAEDYVVFDDEITTHINSCFGRLNQLGIGPVDGYEIVDADDLWSEFLGTDMRLSPVKSYVFLYVKLLFDPPEIGFVLTAMKQQIDAMEWELNVVREDRDHPFPTDDVLPDDVEVVLDGGGP